MDKVNRSNQAMPLWERNSQKRGHRSAVDGALKAHRQRTMERQNRVQDRLNMVKQLQNDFFPTPSAQERVEFETSMNSQQQNFSDIDVNAGQPVLDQVADLNLLESENLQNFQPRTMDEIYGEAQLGTTADSALALVEKDIANPEDGPVEDMPRGSYIDYTV